MQSEQPRGGKIERHVETYRIRSGPKKIVAEIAAVRIIFEFEKTDLTEEKRHSRVANMVFGIKLIQINVLPKVLSISCRLQNWKRKIEFCAKGKSQFQLVSIDCVEPGFNDRVFVPEMTYMLARCIAQEIPVFLSRGSLHYLSCLKMAVQMWPENNAFGKVYPGFLLG